MCCLYPSERINVTLFPPAHSLLHFVSPYLIDELHLLPLPLLPLLNCDYQSSCPCASTTSVQDKSMWHPSWSYFSFPPSPSSSMSSAPCCLVSALPHGN